MAVSIIPSSSLGHCFPMSAQRHSFCWQGKFYLLDKSDNLEELSDMQWQLALYLILGWGIVFLSAQGHSFSWKGESYLLGKSDNLEELGDIQWQLALYLLLAWGIVFLCLLKGIHSAGKMSPIC